MINVNLLPDLKLERLKAARKQKVVSAFSTVAIIAGVALPMLLIALWGGQKALLALTQRSIDSKTEELQNIEDLDLILTVQQQLNTLPELQQQRLYYTTLLNILPQLMPQNASLTSLELTDAGTVLIQGKANSMSTINDFINILDRARLVKGEESREAFTQVTLVQGVPDEGGAIFEISFNYDNELVKQLLEYELRVGGRLIYAPPDGEESDDNDQDPTDEDNNLFGDEVEVNTP